MSVQSGQVRMRLLPTGSTGSGGILVFKAIVVGTDGSETAQEAVRQAAALARLAGSTLHVVTAYGATTAVSALAGAAGYASEALSLPQQQTDAETLLDRTLTGIDVDGLEVAVRARQGEAAEVLMAVARDVEADLIVVGSRGLTGARRFLLGSVPNRIAHHAECSVHIVHTC
jgi:nucleotide-binding universal stress UspA family protein